MEELYIAATHIPQPITLETALTQVLNDLGENGLKLSEILIPSFMLEQVDNLCL